MRNLLNIIFVTIITALLIMYIAKSKSLTIERESNARYEIIVDSLTNITMVYDTMLTDMMKDTTHVKIDLTVKNIASKPLVPMEEKKEKRGIFKWMSK